MMFRLDTFNKRDKIRQEGLLMKMKRLDKFEAEEGDLVRVIYYKHKDKNNYESDEIEEVDIKIGWIKSFVKNPPRDDPSIVAEIVDCKDNVFIEFIEVDSLRYKGYNEWVAMVLMEEMEVEFYIEEGKKCSFCLKESKCVNIVVKGINSRCIQLCQECLANAKKVLRTGKKAIVKGAMVKA